MYVTKRARIRKQVYGVRFSHCQTSIINKGHLKLITKLFDTRWKWNQYMISKIVCLCLFCKTCLGLFYTTTVRDIVVHAITKLYVSTKSMITNTSNVLPRWVSKPRLYKTRKRATKQAMALDYTLRNFCAYKKSLFRHPNVYKISWRHIHLTIKYWSK